MKKPKRRQRTLNGFGSAQIFALDRNRISGKREPDSRNRRGRILPRVIGNKTVLEVYLVGKVLKRVAFKSHQFFICQRRLQYFHFFDPADSSNSIVIAATACGGKLTFKKTEPSLKLSGCFSAES